MIYSSTHLVKACHFNGTEAYEKYEAALDPRTQPERACQLLLQVLADNHGHNFKIQVIADGDMVKHGEHYKLDADYLIDDMQVEAIVMEWQNTNLSVHSDFTSRKVRATTERMAQILVEKLNKAMPRPHWTVVVHETDGIYAEANSGIN